MLLYKKLLLMTFGTTYVELLSHLIFHVKWYCMLSNVNHI